MRKLVLLLLLLACLGCAESAAVVANTGSAEGSTEDFDVVVVQANTPTVMRNQRDADVQFEITVKNRTQEPWTVRRITLQSMAGTTYSIPVTSREYDRTIAPGAQEKFGYWARADVEELGTARQPVTLRTSIEAISASGATREEVFTSRVNGRVQLQISAAGVSAAAPARLQPRPLPGRA